MTFATSGLGKPTNTCRQPEWGNYVWRLESALRAAEERVNGYAAAYESACREADRLEQERDEALRRVEDRDKAMRVWRVYCDYGYSMEFWPKGDELIAFLLGAPETVDAFYGGKPDKAYVGEAVAAALASDQAAEFERFAERRRLAESDQGSAEPGDLVTYPDPGPEKHPHPYPDPGAPHVADQGSEKEPPMN